MRKSDRIIFSVVLGVLFPVLFALVAGTAGYYFSSDERMPYFVAAGLLTGFMIDIFLLKRLVTRVFDLPLWIVGVFYILCNVFIYGFFMGFPAFNVLMAIVAGYYAGRRIVILNIVPPEKEVLIRKVLLFSVVIIILVCLSSAILALHEKTIGDELKGMLGLGFIPKKGLIIAGIVIGGALLVTVQYFLTRITLDRTIKYIDNHDNNRNDKS